jgi:arylsulfatase A-like enzyme
MKLFVPGLWLVLASVLVAPTAAEERPNILFIMSDDHTAQAIGAYATVLKELNPTPTIDSLAAEGIRFDNAFCTNAICTPSRACIITGRYNHNNGVFDLGGNIAPESQMLPIQMRRAGYQTAIIGKWHLKQEPNFDYYKVLPGQGNYFDPEFRVQGDQPWPKNTVAHAGQQLVRCDYRCDARVVQESARSQSSVFRMPSVQGSARLLRKCAAVPIVSGGCPYPGASHPV